MNFGKNLRYIRKLLKLTQMELANLMNVSQRSISHYENGDSEPELMIICRLSSALDISIDALLSYNSFEDTQSYFELAKIASKSKVSTAF